MKLRLVLMCSPMHWRASSGMRMRMAETTEMWLNFTLDSQGLCSLFCVTMNSIIEAWYMMSLGRICS